MKYRRNQAWFDANPYRGPLWTESEARDWAEGANANHSDAFRVMKTERGFEVEQDIPDGKRKNDDHLRSAA